MAKLDIEIGANASKADGVLGRLKSTLGSFSMGLGGIWGKLAGAVGIGVVISKAKETAAALDDLKDRSDNLSMPVEELQRWEYAANDAGLGAEKFGKAVGKLNNLIQDALGGNDDAIGKLTELRLDPEQLKGKSASDQLGMVFDAISRVDDKQKALALASGIFGDKMGTSVLGLAANWRTLKAEIPEEKIFKDADIAAGEAFTKQMAQLDITIQKLVTGSGLLGWLTTIGATMDKIYSTTPSKQDYAKAGVDQPIDSTEAAIRKGRIAADAERKQKLGVRKDVAELQAKREDVSRPVTQAEKNAYNEKHLSPEQKTNRVDAELDQTFSDIDKNKGSLRQAKSEQAAGDIARTGWADKSYNDEIKKIQEKTAAEELLTDKKKAQAEAQKIIIDLENKRKEKGVAPLSADQKASILTNVQSSMTAADNSTIDKQVQSMRDAIAIQELINQGKDKEAYIQQKLIEGQKGLNGEMSAKSKADLRDAAGLEFDTKNASPRDLRPQATNFVSDSALRIGGFHGGQAQYGGTENIQRQQLDSVKKLESITKEIMSKMPQAGTFNQDDNSLSIGYV